MQDLDHQPYVDPAATSQDVVSHSGEDATAVVVTTEDDVLNLPRV